MEILSNIWLFLNTENPSIISLIFMPFYLVEAFSSCLIFSTILNIKCPLKKKILYTLCASVLGALTNFCLQNPFNTIINYLCIFLLIHYIFQLNLIENLLALILPTIIYGLTGYLTLNPYIKILNIPYNICMNVPIYRFFYLLIMYSFVYLIILLIKQFKLGIKSIESFDKRTKYTIFGNFLLGLVIFIIQSVFLFYYIDNFSIVYTLFSFFSLLSYFAVSMYSLTRSTQLAVKTIELQTSTEYNKSLSILYDNVKCFKHDFDNIISTIGGFVQTQDISGLEDYYKSLQADCQKTNNIATLNPKLINNPGIYSLLSSKYHKADKLGIKINLDFFVDLNEFEINTYEFSRILGILLDNAIEAANECAEKIVNIKFRNDTKNHRHLVTISNTYQNKDVDTEEIFEKGVSGKAEHTGLGLWEVHQYVNKHPNLNLYTSKTTELFSQQFEIYYTPVSLLLN